MPFAETRSTEELTADLDGPASMLATNSIWNSGARAPMGRPGSTRGADVSQGEFWVAQLRGVDCRDHLQRCEQGCRSKQEVEAPRHQHRWEAIGTSREEGTRKGQRVLGGLWWVLQLWRGVGTATELVLGQGGQEKCPCRSLLPPGMSRGLPSAGCRKEGAGELPGPSGMAEKGPGEVQENQRNVRLSAPFLLPLSLHHSPPRACLSPSSSPLALPLLSDFASSVHQTLPATPALSLNLSVPQ